MVVFIGKWQPWKQSERTRTRGPLQHKVKVTISVGKLTDEEAQRLRAKGYRVQRFAR